MPPKSPWWQLFYSDKSNYRTNKTYLNAWCSYCPEAHVQQNREADIMNKAQGLRTGLVIISVAALGIAPQRQDALGYDPGLNGVMAAVDPSVQPVRGRWQTMQTHTEKCKHISPLQLATVQAEAAKAKHDESARALLFSAYKENASPPASSSLLHGSSSPSMITPLFLTLTSVLPAGPYTERPSLPPPLKCLKSLSSSNLSGSRPGSSSGPGYSGHQQAWMPSQQQDFAADLCKLFVACNIPWNAANNIELHLFFAKWLSGCQIPDRRKLGGPVLDEEAAKVEAKVAVQVWGKFVTGQCNGWKNVAKTPISIIASSSLYI